MNPSVFIDTSAWYAIVDRRDAAHERLKRAYREGLRLRWVTSDYVLDETLTLLAGRIDADTALRFYDALRASARATVAHTDPGRFEQAVSWMRKHRGQRFSFTDCVSFATMEELGIRTALTLDDDFRLAGFEVWQGGALP